MALVQLALGRFWPQQSQWLPWIWHLVSCYILGIDVEHRGTVLRGQPCLYVCNHLSWLDITVLGSAMPVSFVAKAEVAGWGVFGILAKLQRTVFVARDRRGQTARQAGDMGKRFGQGNKLLLFAEGTSSPGLTVLPFKSALFAVAQSPLPGDQPLRVQPVTIAYTRLNGMRVRRGQWPMIGWYGDMDLLPHFKQVLRHRSITATLIFHPPVTLAELGGRKQLAAHCHKEISSGLINARG